MAALHLESIDFQHYEDITTFNILEIQLIQRANTIMNAAYAPYSNFQVGASVLLENGEMINGANVENAVFPITTCAERVALNYAITNHKNIKISTIAITSQKSNTTIDSSKNELPAFPCGMCRQALLEIELHQRSPIKIILFQSLTNLIVIKKVADILPFGFDSFFLK